MLVPQPFSKVRPGEIAERFTNHQAPPRNLSGRRGGLFDSQWEQTAPPSGKSDEKRRRRFGSRRRRPEAGGGGAGGAKPGQGGEGAKRSDLEAVLRSEQVGLEDVEGGWSLPGGAS